MNGKRIVNIPTFDKEDSISCGIDGTSVIDYKVKSHTFGWNLSLDQSFKLYKLFWWVKYRPPKS